MSLFNEKIKNISLKELLSIIILLFIIQFAVNSLGIISLSSVWIYLFVIAYFSYKLRDCFFSFREDLMSIFSWDLVNLILTVVVLNIFLSYGLLYLANYILIIFPALKSLIDYKFSSLFLNNSLMAVGGFISTVFISPISEELIFRGVLLNKIKIIVPTVGSVVIVSLLFASMHPFGSIISAFVFGVCMAVLYLKTDNILVPIFAHFLNNLFAESIVIMDSSNMLFTNDAVICLMSFLAVISFVLISVSIIKELNNIK